MRHLQNIALVLILSSCSQYLHQPLRITQPRIGSESEQYEALKALPEPRDPLVVAVYKFRDQTGQYKDTEMGASWSTAITQGATSILLRSLEESKWFIPIEREGLNNLLNERKIIRSSREGYGNPDPNQPIIPPLLYGGVLLEGGIISFDSNIMTGGAGARYFGTGASGQYRLDRITIYLRAVSTSNGRILKTVYTSKTILSQQVDVGVFKFVNLRRLLEAETGFTYNEPGEMAVREAIEKAVVSLVVEGIHDNLWQLKEPQDIDHPLIKNYQFEKQESQLTNVFGAAKKKDRSNISIGGQLGGWYYLGDISGATLLPAIGISGEAYSDQKWSVELSATYGRLGTENYYRGEALASELSMKYRWYPQIKTTPFASVGLGSFSEISNNQEDIDPLSKIYPYLSAELGYEYLLSNKALLFASAKYRYLFFDDLDYIKRGNFSDAFLETRIGLRFFIPPKNNPRP